MEKILASALENLRSAVAAAGAEVTHGPLPEVEGDATQLVQVLQNLIGNALKFHADGPPHVRIQATREGPDWEFSVRDDGIGIAPQYQERIFVIFQRLHTREEYPGSGIGLSVVKKVVERHGGRIWVESSGTRGEGTTFRFTLPVERAAPVPAVGTTPRPRDDRVRREVQSLIEDRLRDLV